MIRFFNEKRRSWRDVNRSTLLGRKRRWIAALLIVAAAAGGWFALDDAPPAGPVVFREALRDKPKPAPKTSVKATAKPARATASQTAAVPRALKANGAGTTIRGRVVRVTDGDTIVVVPDEGRGPAGIAQVKVRLLGIDAPEKSQPGGKACRKNLARYVAGQTVDIEVTKQDKYGRTLGRVLAGGKDVNLAQVSDGCAWHYKHFAKDQSVQDRNAYATAEVKARESKYGIWRGGPSPKSPWDYRREKRQ